MSREEFHIQWHITDRCNLRCRHCYQDSFDRAGELEWPALKRIADDLIQTMERMGRRLTISLTGGEPLLKDELWPLIEYLSASDRVADLQIITNATLAGEHIARLTKPSKLTSIDVSLDGVTRAANDAIRGPGSFEATCRGVRALKAGGFKIFLMFTLLRSNRDEALKLFDFIKEYSLDGFILERFIPLGQSRTRKDQLLSASELEELFIAVFKRCGLDYFKESARYHALKVEGGDSFKLYGAECVIARHGCAILPGGNVLPCRRFSLPLGNLLSGSLYDIWRSSEVLKKAGQRESLHGKCRDCTIEDCLGCRALSYALSGDFLGPDQLCWFQPFSKSEV